MTFIMTVVGIVVFFISIFTAGFKSAWKRLMILVCSGLVIDIIGLFIAGAFLYFL